MNISYNEFHVGRKIRDLCNFDQSLFSSSGNVVIKNMANVRKFAMLVNDVFKSRNQADKQISAGQLNAMGLLDEIFHYVAMLYRRDVLSTMMTEMLAALDRQFTPQKVDQLLLDFTREFPPTEVYQEKTTAKEYLSRTALDIGTGKERSNREQTLEELILLHLANENPAFKPFAILFNDLELQKNPLYNKSWAVIQAYAKSKPKFGPFNHDLISMLREPVVYSPNSLRGQLEYIRKHWATLLGDWLKRLLAGIDLISEEEKAAWKGFGGGDLPDMQPYSFEELTKEYERFSPDRDWMPKVILMAKTVLVWLDQLTKKYGYPITRLDQIPDPELDALRDEGFTGLWLIGLWERSNASKRIKQLCGNPEAAASAYSLFDYNIAQNIGGWDALASLRQRLWQRGIRLASDMVPNHTGMDGDWVMNKPDLFVQRRDCPFPTYTFNGENLSHDPRTSVYLEDHYYSKNDCAVVFKRVDNQTGDVRYIYHGNDGTGLPWNDTAQLDYLNPQTREEVIQQILHVARNFPIIRFDAAMVLAKKSIRRLWYPEPGHGGDIATRSETGLSTQQFNDAIPNEFWREVVDRVAQEVPDTLLLAEAFWMMEGFFVRTLGMHRVYNSAFMNMLKKEENQKYRDTVKNTITFDPQILKRYVNFMNNPDEETAIAQFGDGDKYFGVCTLMVTMPGLPMFGHGQIEGFTEKYGMEYTKAYKDEKPNQWLVDRHWREIFPLMHKRHIFANVENFLFYDLWDNGHVNENVFAYSNSCGNEYAVVFYNNKYEQASGWIKQSDPYAVKTADGIQMRSRSISEGLDLTAEDDKYLIFREHRSNLWYIRKSSEICEKGMFVSLNGFEYQVLLDVHQVTDFADHRYKILCETLAGKGCEDIEIAWQEIIYKDLYAALNIFAEKSLKPLAKAFDLAYKAPEPQAENAEKLEKTGKAAKATAKAKKDEEQKSAVVSEKEIKEILADSKESALAFFKVAKNFAGDAKILDAEKQFALFGARVKTLAKIHNEKAVKMPKDITATLAKCKTSEQFAKLMLLTNGTLELALLGWALTADFAETGLAQNWALGRKLSQFLKAENIVQNEDRFTFIKLFILASASSTEGIAKDAKKSALSIVELLVNSPNAGALSGANTFDNIRWFNKEVIESSLNQIVLLMLLDAKESEVLQILSLYKTLQTAKLKAAYKCELLIKQFAPKPVARRKNDKTAKAGIKDTSKDSTKSSASKAGSKAKTAAKKPVGTKKK